MGLRRRFGGTDPIDLGFENLGRLAQLYQSYFGELSREARRRIGD